MSAADIRAAMTAALAARAEAKAAGLSPAEQLQAYEDALEIGHVRRLEDVPTPTGRRCNRHGCYCTHTAPCDAGWMPHDPERRPGQTYERVVPCPQCRPDAYARYVVRIEATSTVRN